MKDQAKAKSSVRFRIYSNCRQNVSVEFQFMQAPAKMFYSHSESDDSDRKNKSGKFTYEPVTKTPKAEKYTLPTFSEMEWGIAASAYWLLSLWFIWHVRAFFLSTFFFTVLVCFSGLALAALQLGKSPAVAQFDYATEPFVCGDVQTLVCDADLPVATVSASTQVQEASWTAQDSCAGGCIYVSHNALEYVIPPLLGFHPWWSCLRSSNQTWMKQNQ